MFFMKILFQSFCKLCIWWGDCVMKTPILYVIRNNDPDILDVNMNIDMNIV